VSKSIPLNKIKVVSSPTYNYGKDSKPISISFKRNKALKNTFTLIKFGMEHEEQGRKDDPLNSDE